MNGRKVEKEQQANERNVPTVEKEQQQQETGNHV